METNNNQNNNPIGQDSIGNAGNEGTQAFNNGNEVNQNDNQESGAFDKTTEKYEGGNLGTAGSGSMEIENDQNKGADANSKDSTSISSNGKIPVPIVKDQYEGGNMGTSGSGGMDINGSASSLSVDALTEKNPSGTEPLNPSRNPNGLGSPPSSPIADGGDGGAKQPKEHTGKETEMGGSNGGTTGLGNGNNDEGLQGSGIGNKGGSESGSGGGASISGS